jgi:2-amino-4-hydroxy-6-hydroxymethyldihydropteridine diphosphokinase
MPRAGIALGSNLGDRLARLRAAVNHLREIATPGEPVLIAPIYQTAPRFCPPGSPDFYNTVIEIAFEGDPPGFLEKTRAIEEKLGRKAQLNLLPLQPGDVPATCADVADLMQDVDFKPATPIEVGISRFIDWYRDYYHC